MDLSTFNLERAFQEEGCAICRLKQQSVARYLFTFLWENVNDGGTRAHFVNALGFCREHAWQLQATEQKQFGAGLGAGIVYEDLTTRALEGLHELRVRESALNPRHWVAWVLQASRRWGNSGSPRRNSVSFPEGLVPREECRVCQVSRSAEEMHIAVLVKGCADAEFRERYRASDGLCLPHLRAALEEIEDRSTRLFLIETAEEKLGALASQLREYLRKQIWDYRAEPKLPAEQSSWIRAIEFFVGKP